MGGFGWHTGRSLPHTAAVTPESLRSCLGRAGIGSPHGCCEGTRRGPSLTQRRSCLVPPVLPRPRRDRGTPRAEDSTRGVPSRTTAVTPESLRSCRNRGGIGTPCGGFGHTERSTTHRAAGTLGSLRSRWGRGGIGTPRGGLGALGEGLPPHSGGHARAPPALLGPGRDRDSPCGVWRALPTCILSCRPPSRREGCGVLRYPRLCRTQRTQNEWPY